MKPLQPFDLESYCDGLAKAGTEHAEQRAFIGWCLKQAQLGVYPKATMVFAIPNGGKRDAITAARLKAEGVQAGVPDLCYPMARAKYFSLYIEMKCKGGSVSDIQRDFHLALRLCGHAVSVCWNWRAAVQCFNDYHGDFDFGVKDEYK